MSLGDTWYSSIHCERANGGLPLFMRESRGWLFLFGNFKFKGADFDAFGLYIISLIINMRLLFRGHLVSTF